MSDGFKSEIPSQVNPDLQEERNSPSFNVTELTNLIDGGVDKTNRRKKLGQYTAVYLFQLLTPSVLPLNLMRILVFYRRYIRNFVPFMINRILGLNNNNYRWMVMLHFIRMGSTDLLGFFERVFLREQKIKMKICVSNGIHTPLSTRRQLNQRPRPFAHAGQISSTVESSLVLRYPEQNRSTEGCSNSKVRKQDKFRRDWSRH